VSALELVHRWEAALARQEARDAVVEAYKTADDDLVCPCCHASIYSNGPEQSTPILLGPCAAVRHADLPEGRAVEDDYGNVVGYGIPDCIWCDAAFYEPDPY
jgi:hypothetical protein